MDEHFDINQALRAYDKIATHGTKVGDSTVFDSISAWSDFDGYTIALSNTEVTLTIYFHNKYEFDNNNAKQIKAFTDQLKKIDSMKF